MPSDTAASILSEISAMQWASRSVQGNRAKINTLFNGDPPRTEAERKANRLTTNFNFLEPTRIAANSRRQIYNAFFQPGDFFRISLDSGPPHMRELWGVSLTSYINKCLRRDRRFRNALEQAHAQTVLHGMGPSVWPKRNRPTPDTCGVEDVIVPAGTLADMSNLDRFAIYREWTWAQLYDLTHGKTVDQGWNTEYVDSLLENLFKQPLQSLFQGNRWLFPEKLSEDMKENTALYGGAALPKVLAWDRYALNEDTGKLDRRIILDYNNIQPSGFKDFLAKERPEFLYEKDNYADDWTNVIHWFIGNCSNVAPFRYYSIRSIGYLLYGVSLLQNNIRCRLADHVLTSLLTWFRNVSEDDREKLEDIALHHLGIFPDGVSMVGAQERYTADHNVVMMQLNQNRQLMAESASSFLPDIAVEGEKPAMTATESLIRNNASVTLTSAVLNQLYNDAEPFYRECCRRFCLQDSDDPLVEKFLEEVDELGIPREMLDVEKWEIIPNRVMGGGNKAVQLTSSRALFDIRGSLGPQGAVRATQKYVLALTDDARETAMLVPEEQPISDAAMLANLSFGTLMEGVPMLQKKGPNEVDYIETLLNLMAAAMEPLQAMEGNPDTIATMSEKIAGLVNVAHNIEQHIAVLAQDKMEKDRVTNYNHAVQGLMLQLKGFAQRLQEMEQAKQEQQGVSPEAQAKIISAKVLAEAQAQIAQGLAFQKRQHADAKFLADKDRKDAQSQAEIQRKLALTQADITSKDLTTRAGLIHDARQAEQDRALAAAAPAAASK